MNLLPFLQIKRVMFLYHYAVALMFAVLMLAYLADKLEKQKWLIPSLLIASALLFIFFAPLSYGLPLSPEQYHLRTWFNGWI